MIVADHPEAISQTSRKEVIFNPLYNTCKNRKIHLAYYACLKTDDYNRHLLDQGKIRQDERPHISLYRRWQ